MIKIFFKYLLIYIFLSFLISFISSSRNSNGEFLHLVFVFDGSGSGSSSAAFLLASKIIEPQSPTNLIASFLPLKSLTNAFFLFFRFISNPYFFQISIKFFLFLSCSFYRYFEFFNTIKKSYRIF